MSGTRDLGGALEAPAVSPLVYDSTYYRTTCIGAPQWSASGGAAVSGIYYGFLERAGLRPGEVVVDLGTGRADLLAAAIDRGAGYAYGIDYSSDALELARQTIRVNEIADRAEVALADARRVPLPDGIADLVCMLEVAEHLTEQELGLTLSEGRRLLKPGGRILIHTMPNRLIYTVTYRLLRAAAGRRWPAEPRNVFEQQMHVNELTVRRLRRAMHAAGFQADVRLGEWIYTDHVPSRLGRGVYQALARLGPLAELGIADIWALGRP
jgi:ubiquinone/menaquinone biosynthesis C-methylase UbiE